MLSPAHIKCPWDFVTLTGFQEDLKEIDKCLSISGPNSLKLKGISKQFLYPNGQRM